ncbi:MAG: glycosyltransferase family 39 protein [Bacteroidetes bacterium]|nr:glycosyltransferase family 39 protein [Bacteroidota bacterium]
MPATITKNRLILVLSSITLIVHLYAILFGGFSYFRDELYYLESTRHLDFGYVDHPPLSIWLLWLITSVFGDSVGVIRIVPAVFSAVVVFLSCKTAQKTGGGSFAMFLTAITVSLMPIFMGMNSVYSMNFIDWFFWALLSYLAVDLIQEPQNKKFIVWGIVAGFGMLNKISIAWLIAGFFAALLVSDKRKLLKTPYPWISGVIALIIFSPYIVWNVFNDFAHLEFMRNAVEMKYSQITRVQFLMDQLMLMSPFAIVLAFCGVWYSTFNPAGRKDMAPAVIWLTTLMILLVNSHSKAEYLGAAYPALIALGAVFLESKLNVSKLVFYPVKFALPVLIIGMGIIAIPVVVPVLKVEDTIKYFRLTGLNPQSNEGHKLTELHQFYADMHGWEELVESVRKVVDSIPGKDTLSILIVANNYGEASAINVIGRKYNLPYCTTEHNSYWLWGVPREEYDMYISLGDSEEDVKTYAINPELKGVHTAKYSMPYENNLNIWVAKRLKYPFKELWKKAKKYI